MKITILSLFPEMFVGPFDHSILKHAQQKKLVTIEIVNIRDFGIGGHKIVDDTSYGGGTGMVMRVDVLHRAIQGVQDPSLDKKETRVILLSAQGKPFHESHARTFLSYKHLILLCGHYEGVDDRVKKYIDEEVSIGDFVTTGGEIPSMLITDSVVRLLPGVLKKGATETESFSLQTKKGTIMLEYPHFTKPQTYDSQSVPDVLLSGNHAAIEKWRHEQALSLTEKNRIDLLKNI